MLMLVIIGISHDEYWQRKQRNWWLLVFTCYHLPALQNMIVHGGNILNPSNAFGRSHKHEQYIWHSVQKSRVKGNQSLPIAPRSNFVKIVRHPYDLFRFPFAYSAVTYFLVDTISPSKWVQGLSSFNFYTNIWNHAEIKWFCIARDIITHAATLVWFSKRSIVFLTQRYQKFQRWDSLHSRAGLHTALQCKYTHPSS